MNDRTRGFTAALTATLVWGAQFPVLAVVLVDLDPFWLTLIRYLAATLILAAIVLFREGRSAFSLEGRGWTVALLGTLGFSLFNVALLLGIRISGPQHGALFVATTPLLTVLISWLRGGAAPSARTLGFLGLAFLGVALVVTKGDPASILATGAWTGDLLMVGGALCWAVYTSWASAFSTWSPIRFTMAVAFFGTGATAAITLVALGLGRSHVPTAAGLAHALPGMVFLIVFGAVISLVAWNTAINTLGSAVAVLFMNIVPVTSFAIALIFGARFPVIEYVGAALTILALVLNNVLARTSLVLPALEHDGAALDDERRVA